MSSSSALRFNFNKKGEKCIMRIAALLDLGNNETSPVEHAISYALELGLQAAEEHVKGLTVRVYTTPKQAEIMANNPEFFRALCEEGVIEWLEPLVLAGKAKKSGDV